MKTVKDLRSNKIERVRDDIAQKLVKNNTHMFIPKKMWKEQIRDI